jgi:hypothetical protein
MNEPAGTAATATDRPLGLGLLIWLFSFWAGASLLVILLLVMGDGPIPLGGVTVPREEALARILPILGPIALAAAGAALALALEKPWARGAVLLPFSLAAVSPAYTGAARSPLDLALGALAILPLAAVLVWYLYFRPRVVAYFSALRAQGQSAGAGRGNGAPGNGG